VFAGAQWSVIAVALLWVARTILLVPLHMLLLRRLLGMSFADLVRPMLAPLGAGAFMGACVMTLRLALDAQGASDLVKILAIVPAGAMVYGAAIWLLSPQLFGMAIRTASIIVGPFRKKPVLASKGVET
jgi:hypothetical protein